MRISSNLISSQSSFKKVSAFRSVSRLAAWMLLICVAMPGQAVEPEVLEMAPKVYDLESRPGVLAVYQRVQTIAEQHCVASEDLAQALSANQRSCRDRVLEQLLGKLADPYLSYLHENPDAQRLARR